MNIKHHFNYKLLYIYQTHVLFSNFPSILTICFALIYTLNYDHVWCLGSLYCGYSKELGLPQTSDKITYTHFVSSAKE